MKKPSLILLEFSEMKCFWVMNLECNPVHIGYELIELFSGMFVFKANDSVISVLEKNER